MCVFYATLDTDLVVLHVMSNMLSKITIYASGSQTFQPKAHQNLSQHLKAHLYYYLPKIASITRCQSYVPLSTFICIY